MEWSVFNSAVGAEMDWEPDLHAQLRALEDGALATDTDPGDALLSCHPHVTSGGRVTMCALVCRGGRTNPRRPAELSSSSSRASYQ